MYKIRKPVAQISVDCAPLWSEDYWSLIKIQVAISMASGLIVKFRGRIYSVVENIFCCGVKILPI